jgi:hypothetical protein
VPCAITCELFGTGLLADELIEQRLRTLPAPGS